MDRKLRLNSEKKIENEQFKIKIGTTNKVNPQAIYVDGRAFIMPLLDKDDYIDDINEIRRNFKQTLSSNLRSNDIFEHKFILDFNIASNRMYKDKKSFLSFQFLLKQPKEHILKLKDVKHKSDDLIKKLMFSLGNDIIEHNFSIHKSKK